MRENLHPDEALRLVVEAAPPPHFERVPLDEALGRALPRPVVSPIDHPPFDKSAMDGYAFAPDCSSGRGVYRVVGTVAAGSPAPRQLAPGECVRIMTGAPLPDGAAGVQRIEWSEDAGRDASGAACVRFLRPESVSNIIRRGENLGRGAILLEPRILAPQDIGILASAGIAEVEVARRPCVGVISTGDELVNVQDALKAASIYDSNGPQLAAQARAIGAQARFYGAFPDKPAALTSALAQALDECEVVLVSGGVSMGDFDHVPRALEACGVEPIFHKLAMRPGKPTYFGTRAHKAVFGLPGNPVSTFVNFELLVRPHLKARMGLPQPVDSRIVRARLATPLSRKGADRVEFLPARLDAEPGGLCIKPLSYHGSSMLNVLAEADCLVRMELGIERLEEGSMVDARLIRS